MRYMLFFILLLGCDDTASGESPDMGGVELDGMMSEADMTVMDLGQVDTGRYRAA